MLRAPPFSSFPREALERLAGASLARVARRGVVLFRRGDPPGSAYLIERGAVRLSATTPEGRLIVFRLAGASESLGLLSVLDGEPRSADAVAMVDSRLVAIPRAAVHEAM